MPAWQFIQVVQGTNGANASIATTKMTKTGGVNSTFDAGASTVNKITGDGFIECAAPANVATSFQIIGFSIDDPGKTRDEIDFGVYLRGGLLAFFSNGTDYGVYPSVAAGDKVRIQRIGTQVTAYKNGELVFTFPVACTGSQLVDTSLFNTSPVSELDQIRLFDASTGTFPTLTWQNSANVTIAADTAFTTRRMTFTAPTKMKAGDQLIVVFGSQGPEAFTAPSSSWTFVDTFRSPTNLRSFSIYRRIATDSEPSTYTFDLNTLQETLGMLLVYRSLDNGAAALSSSAVDIAATSAWPCPARTLTRYSDLYIGMVFQVPNNGGILYMTNENPRLDFSQSVFGSATPRLAVFDFAADAIGATDIKPVTFISSGSGAAGSIALLGLPAPGQGLSWLPPTPGAIGLPTEGI